MANEFLDLLPLNQLPPEGKYIKLDGSLDLNRLFDTSFYKKKVIKQRLALLMKHKAKSAYDPGIDENIKKTQDSLQDLHDNHLYNPNFPLTRYLSYHGSESTPPCNCNLILIICRERQVHHRGRGAAHFDVTVQLDPTDHLPKREEQQRELPGGAESEQAEDRTVRPSDHESRPFPGGRVEGVQRVIPGERDGPTVAMSISITVHVRGW